MCQSCNWHTKRARGLESAIIDEWRGSSAYFTQYNYSLSSFFMMMFRIESGILGALENFEEMNQKAYDYWVSELYDVNGDKIADKWNIDVLYEMEEDYVCLF